MTRKQIIVAVGLAVVALLMAGFLWLRVGLPFVIDRAQAFLPPPPAAPAETVPENPRALPPRILAEEIVGIGAALRTDPETGMIEVINTIPGSPAERAGLTAGWIIQKVDDAPLAGRPLAESVQRIRGSVGTKVRLEVVDPWQNLTNTVEVTRERIRIGGGR